MMVNMAIGKLVKPPAAKDYVKLELLINAKKSLNIKVTDKNAA